MNHKNVFSLFSKFTCVILFSILFTGCSYSGEIEDYVSKEEVKDTAKEIQEDLGKSLQYLKEKTAESSLNSDNQNSSISDDSFSEDSILTSPEDINLRNPDGAGSNYLFTYLGEDFDAIYTPDNWKIKNSYKINNEEDLVIICEALSAEHPVHGKDMQSYRTPDDMAYEWVQHNLVYAVLPSDSSWRHTVQDVDLDPKDQGKSFDELYEDRTGKKFEVEDVLKSILN